MKNNVIFDTSALMALIQKEKGAKVITPLLNQAVMSCINVAETFTVLMHIEISPQEFIISISEMIPLIVSFDFEQVQLCSNKLSFINAYNIKVCL